MKEIKHIPIMPRCVLSLLLFLALLCTLLPQTILPARAEDDPVYSGSCGENLTWSLDPESGVLTLSGSGPMTDYPRQDATPWYPYRNSITSFSLPEEITSIGSHAFNRCNKVKTIVFPQSVTKIGSSAFYCCTSLESVTFSQNLTEIQNWAFYGCTKLQSINFPDSISVIGEAAFQGCRALVEVSIPENLTEIDSTVFSGCTGLRSVSLPQSLTEIPPYTFSGCTNLTTIIFSDSLTSIGEEAFKSCSGLTSFNFPETLTSIQDYAFSHCTGLSEVFLPNGITAVNNGVFYKCSALTSVRFPEGLTTIGRSAFSDCTGLTELNLPASVVDIGSYCFEGCTGLTELTFPAGLETINYKAFQQCTGLISVTFLNGFSSFEASAFSGCVNLIAYYAGPESTMLSHDENGVLFNKDKTILLAYPCGRNGAYSIPNSVTEIEKAAFYDCASLTAITLPSNLNAIGSRAFLACAELASIQIPNGVAVINSGTFNGCTKLASVNLPDSLQSIGSEAFCGCASLAAVSFPASLTAIGEKSFMGCVSLSALSIPSGFSISSFGSNAFSDCTGLTEIVFQEGITGIANNAFTGCTSLTSIQLPDSLTLLSGFNGCTALTSLQLPEGLVSIGGFVGCTALTNISFPNSLKYINYGTFSRCTALTSVSIPKNVVSIEKCAFADCSSLAEITIESFACNIFDDSSTLGNPAYTTLYGYEASTTQQYAERYGYEFVSLGGTVISGNCGADGDNLQWSLNTATGLLTIEGSGKMSDYGQPTVSSNISPWYPSKHVLRSVSFPAELDSIGSYAFYDCDGLTTLSLPEQISVIGYDAFNQCSSITEITIPESVREIYSYAFANCSALTSVTLLPERPVVFSCVFSKCTALTDVSFPEGYRKISESMFSGCTALTELNLPEGLLSINRAAFSGCTALTSVSFQGNLNSIGKDAFKNCTSLSTINFPDSCSSIGPTAFQNCTGLSELVFPINISSVGASAFSGCTGLTSVKIMNSACQIAANSDTLGLPDQTTLCGFEDSSTQQYAEQYGYTFASFGPRFVSGFCSVDDNALFWSLNRALGLLTFDGSGTMQDYSLENEAPWYSYRNEIISIKFPENTDKQMSYIGMKTIGSYAFYGCTNLNSAQLPPTLDSIGAHAFQGCDSLTEIQIPDNLSTIGSDAFSDCTKLLSVFFQNNQICSIDSGSNTLGLPGQTTIYGHRNTTAQSYAELYGYTFELIGKITHSDCCGYDVYYTYDDDTNILTVYGNGAIYDFLDPENPHYSLDFCWLDPWFLFCEDVYEISVSEGVTRIGNNAFAYFSNLHLLSLPESLVSIGSGSFSFCESLSNISFPSCLNNIDEYAFFGCKQLSSVILPENVAFIGKNAFRSCTSLTTITVYNPGCDIAPYTNTLGNPAQTVIYGFRNSTAQSYAETYGYTFVSLGDFTVSGDYQDNIIWGFNSETGVLVLEGSGVMEGFSNASDAPWYPYRNLITSVVLPEGLTAVGSHAFEGFTALDSVTVPESVEFIGENAFADCTALTELVIRNPSCLIYDGADAANPNGTRGADNPETLGNRELTLVFGKHMTALETAEPVSLAELGLGEGCGRFVENYAKTHDYTFCTTNAFADVADSCWYELPVSWAYAKGIAAGTGAERFSPNAKCTREQIVTFLWRAAGSPAHELTESPFLDVKPDKYYYDAVLWAFENEITSGTGGGKFGVGQACTREQVVTFLWKTQGSPESEAGELPFSDVPAEAYYSAAVRWAWQNGITSGVSPDLFGGALGCSRAQIVTFLYHQP